MQLRARFRGSFGKIGVFFLTSHLKQYRTDGEMRGEGEGRVNQAQRFTHAVVQFFFSHSFFPWSDAIRCESVQRFEGCVIRADTKRGYMVDNVRFG